MKTWNRIESRSSVLDRDARGGASYAHLLSGGLPAYVQQTGFATRGPTTSVPYVDTAVGPQILPKYLDERILRVPNVMRMGAQHMQPSPFGAMCLLKAQCIPSQPSPHEVAWNSNIEERRPLTTVDGCPGLVHDELNVGVQHANVVIPNHLW